MTTGRVKWFSEKKGYGFIEREDADDVFVRFPAIQSEGFRSLHEGEKVAFEVIKKERCLEAANVVKLN